ncbi:DUF2269 family protein [Roseospira visakhapatnamensis]|uniref:DUF2269 family protein n=1 Tax=Roseospira visakhapatnamensis TaxID=390880 RepID=A0A7W6RH90_9PROT|nr:DUF2269 family protein [Roseospira visakhapatnamensis]MBB4267946.1 hypothetical protein [Roseospira visakhapatnamensis]
MDQYYTVLVFSHVLGFILLGGGLCAVFLSELRAYRAVDLLIFVESARFTALCYDALVLPGALIAGASGLLLILELELGFFEQPWVVGMWGLFVFEFVEGNILTRIQFRRTLRESNKLLEHGRLTEVARAEARTMIGLIVHFLDLPLFAVIVYCGVVRPETWADLAWAIGVAVVVAGVLTAFVPRWARRDLGTHSGGGEGQQSVP